MKRSHTVAFPTTTRVDLTVGEYLRLFHPPTRSSREYMVMAVDADHMVHLFDITSGNKFIQIRREHVTGLRSEGVASRPHARIGPFEVDLDFVSLPSTLAPKASTRSETDWILMQQQSGRQPLPFPAMITGTTTTTPQDIYTSETAQSLLTWSHIARLASHSAEWIQSLLVAGTIPIITHVLSVDGLRRTTRVRMDVRVLGPGPVRALPQLMNHWASTASMLLLPMTREPPTFASIGEALHEREQSNGLAHLLYQRLPSTEGAASVYYSPYHETLAFDEPAPTTPRGGGVLWTDETHPRVVRQVLQHVTKDAAVAALPAPTLVVTSTAAAAEWLAIGKETGKILSCYQRQAQKLTVSALETAGVVLTTYHTFTTLTQDILAQVHWQRLVLDQPDTAAARRLPALQKLSADYIWILGGQSEWLPLFRLDGVSGTSGTSPYRMDMWQRMQVRSQASPNTSTFFSQSISKISFASVDEKEAYRRCAAIVHWAMRYIPIDKDAKRRRTWLRWLTALQHLSPRLDDQHLSRGCVDCALGAGSKRPCKACVDKVAVVSGDDVKAAAGTAACGLCHQSSPQRDSVQVTACGHVFCRTCWSFHQHHQKACTVCSTDMEDVDRPANSTNVKMDTASDDESGVPSKLERLIGRLQQPPFNKPGYKTVICSQFRSTVRSIADACREQKISCVEIQHSTAVGACSESVKTFYTSDKCNVMVVAMKRAVGLHVENVDRLIFFEPTLVPDQERLVIQHMRPRKVHYQVMEESIDEAILKWRHLHRRTRTEFRAAPDLNNETLMNLV